METEHYLTNPTSTTTTTTISSTQSLTYQAAAAAHLLYFGVSRCRPSQFARCFMPAQFQMWNDLPYTVFDTGTLDEFKVQSTVAYFPELCFPPVFHGAGACGVVKAI